MSAIHEYQYQQQRRREEYLNRIQRNTQRFAESYKDVLQSMRIQGLDQVVPSEFRHLESALARLDGMISSNPERARELSVGLGDEVYGLRRLAQSLRNQVRGQQRDARQESSHTAQQEEQRKLILERREQQQKLSQEEAAKQLEQQKAHDLWYQLRAEFTDPIIRDFAFDELEKLQNEYKDLSENQLRSRVQQIKSTASQQASVWKKKQIKASQIDTQLEMIEVQQQQIKSDLNQNPKELQAILNSLEQSRDFLIKGGQIEQSDFHKSLAEQIERADEAVTDERCRQLTVRGIVTSLKEQGFVLSKAPELIRNEDRDEVIIQARRLSGRQSEFRVSLDGAFSYKFEHYVGMACKNDLDDILPKLQEIYGIELSNKKVIWENPDRNLRSARSMDDTKEHENDN